MTSKSPQREEIPQAKSSSNTRAQNAKRGAEWLLDEHDLRAHQPAVDVGRSRCGEEIEAHCTETQRDVPGREG